MIDRNMKIQWVFIAVLLALTLSATTAARATIPDLDVFKSPIDIYGHDMQFDIIRSGSKIGEHTVRFTDQDGGIVVESSSRMKIDILFFTAFRYQYDSRAVWRNGALENLTVSVDDDGALFSMNAKRQNQRLHIENGSEKYDTRLPVFPTNHWNPAVLGQSQVLNTLTGKLNNVTIRKTGKENITTEAGSIPAMRYSYGGDLVNDVWYDDKGRWVKLRFHGRDGSLIEYVCRRCLGGKTSEMAQ